MRAYLLGEEQLSDAQPHSSGVDTRLVFQDTDNNIVQIEPEPDPPSLFWRI